MIKHYKRFGPFKFYESTIAYQCDIEGNTFNSLIIPVNIPISGVSGASSLLAFYKKHFYDGVGLLSRDLIAQKVDKLIIKKVWSF